MKYITLREVALMIRLMPTDQAEQKIKSMLSGQPGTVEIEGELVVILKPEK
jgi:hypothetical protein